MRPALEASSRRPPKQNAVRAIVRRPPLAGLGQRQIVAPALRRRNPRQRHDISASDWAPKPWHRFLANQRTLKIPPRRLSNHECQQGVFASACLGARFSQSEARHLRLPETDPTNFRRPIRKNPRNSMAREPKLVPATRSTAQCMNNGTLSSARYVLHALHRAKRLPYVAASVCPARSTSYRTQTLLVHEQMLRPFTLTRSCASPCGKDQRPCSAIYSKVAIQARIHRVARKDSGAAVVYDSMSCDSVAAGARSLNVLIPVHTESYKGFLWILTESEKNERTPALQFVNTRVARSLERSAFQNKHLSPERMTCPYPPDFAGLQDSPRMSSLRTSLFLLSSRKQAI